jgi:hypothetical protein
VPRAHRADPWSWRQGGLAHGTLEVERRERRKLAHPPLGSWFGPEVALLTDAVFPTHFKSIAELMYPKSKLNFS